MGSQESSTNDKCVREWLPFGPQRRGGSTMSAFTLWIATLVLSILLFACSPKPALSKDRLPGARTITFDADTSLGMLLTRDYEGSEQPWEELGEARGRVTVPPGKAVLLRAWSPGGGTYSVGNIRGLRLDPNALQALDLRFNTLEDDALSVVSHQTSLAELDLTGTGIGDGALAHLANMHSLRRLLLHDTRVTDLGLRHLNHLEGLEELGLAATRVTNEGLAVFADLPNLRALFLSNADYGQGSVLSDAALLHLCGLTRLHTLVVADSGITDAGLASLASLKSLRKLDISRNDVGDNGIANPNVA